MPTDHNYSCHCHISASTSCHAHHMKKILILTLLAISLLLASGCRTTDMGALDAFKSDNVPFNAIELHSSLLTTGNPPIKALEKALHSDDYQQRQMSADVLRSLRGYQPTRRLLEVTVEGLGDDQLPYESTPQYDATVHLFNAREGVQYLLDHGPKAKKYLLKGIHSDDLQMQYFCAYILGIHGIKADIELSSSILIRHLRDNDICGDAAAACSALYRLEDAVVPCLRQALPSNDRQQTHLIQLILKDLTAVPFNRKERGMGTRDFRISSQHRDPAIEITTPGFYFPSGREALRKAIYGPSRHTN